MASSTNNEGGTYGVNTKISIIVGFDDIYAKESNCSPESNSGNTIDSQAKEGQNFLVEELQVDTLAAVDHEQAVKVSLEVADSISKHRVRITSYSNKARQSY